MQMLHACRLKREKEKDQESRGGGILIGGLAVL